MTPYYDHGGITIYHGDCLDVLESLIDRTVACVVTDPPYASGARTEAGKKTSGAMLRGQRWAQRPIENDQLTTPGFIWLIREVAKRCVPLLVDGGGFLSFIDWRQWPNLVGALETANLRVNTMIVWDKEHMGLGNGFRVQHELIAYATKGTARPNHMGTPNVLRHRRDSNRDHPSPKPVGLMHQLLRVCGGYGDLVVDPFMGCGPTLVAAKDLGMRAVGIEMEEKYCEIAAKRLAQEVMRF